MGKLYLGTDIAGLAEKLAANLDEAARTGDFFSPATIVVPNHFLRKWLRLRLARQFGIAINLRFTHLEEIFGELLREIDPRTHAQPIELMEDATYRLLILSVLLDEKADGPALQPLRDYLGRDRRRDEYRRAWQLSVRLADLIREYEYQRRDDVILPWLAGKDAYPDATENQLRLERAQRELFRLITREPDGLRAMLGRSLGKLLKTLPQYAGEIMEIAPGKMKKVPPRTIHVFGIAQVSAFHHMVLRTLGRKYDIRIYHLNPLIGRLPSLPKTAGAARDALRALADRYRPAAALSSGDELLTSLGQAGAEGLWLMADLLAEPRSFPGEIIPPLATLHESSTVLTHLQQQLLGVRAKRKQSSSISQDTSLQIVACPGMQREVETVYQSILHNLQHDPLLQQTDIAVLVTDLERYRPVIRAVFERQPRRISFNLADFTVAGLSAFGHGVVGLLDLALESFTRSRVFAVLLNPCFLERLGVKHEQALTWLDWAASLGIYHAWDRDDKKERGYPDSAIYSWRLGLQRLRLGRLMDCATERDAAPAPQYQEVIPFADMASADKDQLDAFCRAVEGLLPRLARLRHHRASGASWASELRKLIADFFRVPDDRPEDIPVRDQLLTALRRLPTLDQLSNEAHPPQLPLSLVREFVVHHLESLENTAGEFLTGGVTISSLPPLRAVPFRIVYVVGLGEGLFPGSHATSVFDLRGRERRPGDVMPPEANRYLLLEAILAAREKLYLLYDCKELQKDEELQPCSPLNQLRRHVEQHILGNASFETVKVPLRAHDPMYLKADNPKYTDVLMNYNEADRLLAILDARRNGALKIDDLFDQNELDRRLAQSKRCFDLPANPTGLRKAASGVSVSLGELRGFLNCPAEAAVKRHLGLRDTEEPEAVDDEPFYTDSPFDFQLVREFVHRFTLRAVAESVETALTDWRQRFAELHEEWRLRGRVPEDAFGTVDQARLMHMAQKRIEGAAGLATFLKPLQHAEFCGPILLGENRTPIGPRTRFPALQLPLAALPEQDAHVSGVLPYAWRTSDAVSTLIISRSKTIAADHLAMPMLESALFFLALQAGAESRDWLGKRSFQIHVAGEEGIVGYCYEPGDIPADESREYLGCLVRDFLDPAGLDLLPFGLVGGDRLRAAYVLEDGDLKLEQLRSDYAELLRESIAESLEMPPEYSAWRPMKLMEIVQADVPGKAFEIVRRRFRPLDRAPAKQRLGKGGSPRGRRGPAD